MAPRKKRLLISSFLLIDVFITIILVINLVVFFSTEDQITDDLSQLPQAQAVLILGSRVRADGSLSPYLRDRVESGYKVYQEGKADKIIVSGDHGNPAYNEVQAMKNALREKEVPEEDIFMDHAGFDTYDSLYRAKHIFQAESLIVVSQNFHLPRAVYTGTQLGLTTHGYPSERFRSPWWFRESMREWLANIKSFLDLHILNSKPTYEGEAIPITGDGRLTQDEPQ